LTQNKHHNQAEIFIPQQKIDVCPVAKFIVIIFNIYQILMKSCTLK